MRYTPTTRYRTAAAAAAALLAAALAPPPAAAAAVPAQGPGPATPAVSAAPAAGCTGKLIESRNLTVAKKKVGELDVYFDRKKNRNCAVMNHANATWGKKLRTRAWVGVCTERKPTHKPCHIVPKSDHAQEGKFAYRAGPVWTRAASSGRCISASGYLWIGGKRYTVGTSPWVGHCG
ncbi:hypothetical protein GCM10010123_16110 [Pilimelia anulata]|uniref:Secreted protein n=1 Tax=Pilimelia anulata TaxID=53371 RepID=A0A8J3F7B6_9ACTN|nr:hypothetical protein [Pilimelia anulata]GGJ87312.1 hypothetical protein GCM10010123_16110 [Pilimelia anulata]